MTQLTMPATLFIIDLNKSDDLDRLCNILEVRQRTGLWPDVVIVTPPPVIIPPPVIVPVKTIRVKVGLIGWVRPLPNALPGNSAISMLRPGDGWKPIVKTVPGWTNIATGWVINDVLEFGV